MSAEVFMCFCYTEAFDLLLCSEKKNESSKYSKKDKDSSKSKSSSHNDYSEPQKRSEKPPKCWLYPQTRVRIISKDYKKGKYYNKKVDEVICGNSPCLFVPRSLTTVLGKTTWANSTLGVRNIQYAYLNSITKLLFFLIWEAAIATETFRKRGQHWFKGGEVSNSVSYHLHLGTHRSVSKHCLFVDPINCFVGDG